MYKQRTGLMIKSIRITSAVTTPQQSSPSHNCRFSRKSSKSKQKTLKIRQNSHQKCQNNLIKEKFLKNICKVRNDLINDQKIRVKTIQTEYQTQLIKSMQNSSRISYNNGFQQLSCSTNYSNVNDILQRLRNQINCQKNKNCGLQDELLKVRKQFIIILQENKSLREQKNKFSQKLQDAFIQHQHQLHQTNNKLQQLKNFIKQSRIEELNQKIIKLEEAKKTLEIKNFEYKLKIEELNKKNIQMSQQISLLKEDNFHNTSLKQKCLQNELLELKKHFYNSKDHRDQIMENKMDIIELQLKKKSQQLQSIQIKLSCIQKKHSDEIKKLTMHSTDELISLRKKYSKLLVEFKKKKEINNNDLRENRFLSENNRVFTLDLSP